MKTYHISGCLLLLWLTTGFVQAQQVTETTVRTVATNFINRMYPNKIRTIQSVYREGKNPMQQAFSDATTNINVITFNQGGWIVVSNNESAPPVLAFSENGTFNTDTNNMHPGLIELMQDYRNMVTVVCSEYVAKGGSDFVESRNEWDKLKNDQTKGTPAVIYVDDLLKDEYGRRIVWDQEGSCDADRAYNKYMPRGYDIIGTCHYGKKPAGCGTVAMAQIMRYWKFPPQYEWDEMPCQISSSTPVYQADYIAHLYKDCGEANNMHYLSCSGSFTTVEDLTDGFNSFQYTNAERKRKGIICKKQWQNYIRSNLDLGRPIVYRGDKCDVCLSKHIWNISGYGSGNYFYCNWGWGGNEDGWYRLDSLKPYAENYRVNHMMIRYIFPNWNVQSVVTFENITRGLNEDLRAFHRKITLRNVKFSDNAQVKLCFTDTLTIEGELTIGPGTSFILQSCSDEATTAQAMQANTNRDDELDWEVDAEISDQTEVSVWATLPPEIEEEANGDVPNNVWGLWPNPNQGSFEVMVSAPHVRNQTKTLLVYSPDGSLAYETDFDGDRCHIQGITSKGLHLVLLKTSERIYPLKMVIK